MLNIFVCSSEIAIKNDKIAQQKAKNPFRRNCQHARCDELHREITTCFALRRKYVSLNTICNDLFTEIKQCHEYRRD